MRIEDKITAILHKITPEHVKVQYNDEVGAIELLDVTKNPAVRVAMIDLTWIVERTPFKWDDKLLAIFQDYSAVIVSLFKTIFTSANKK